MKDDYRILLEKLIEGGEQLKDSIQKVKTEGIIAPYHGYEFPDELLFTTWKNNCIRFLEKEFSGDRAIQDFEESVKIGKFHNYPKMMRELLGILRSCLIYPKIERPHLDNPQNPQNVFNITANQQQTQTQNITVNIIFEAIKDELTDSQLKEIQQVIDENKEKNSLKDRLIDKLKSFGSDVLSNVLANIITNPAIWSHF